VCTCGGTVLCTPDILFSSNLTTVLLYMKGHSPVYSNYFMLTWLDRQYFCTSRRTLLCALIILCSPGPTIFVHISMLPCDQIIVIYPGSTIVLPPHSCISRGPALIIVCSPGPTTVFFHIKDHSPMCSDDFMLTQSNPSILFAYVETLSYVL
jgi:hypothetical protein